MHPVWSLLLLPSMAFGQEAILVEDPGETIVVADDDDLAAYEEEAGVAGGEEEDTPAGEEDAPVMETVVRDRAPAWTASADRVEGPALGTAPRRTTEDLLRLVPGLLVVQHGAEGKGHQIFLRGFDAAHGTDVEVLVAGLPINMLSNVHGHGYLDLNFIPPEVVESLEVRPGAFDLRQGDLATAGTIRLDLGVPRAERGTRLSYESGLTRRHRLLGLWAPEGRANHFVASEYVRDEGFGSDRWTRRVSLMGQLDGEGAGWGPRVVIGIYTATFGSPNAVRLADVESGDMGLHDTYTHGLEGRSDRAFAVVSRRLDLGRDRLELLAGATATRFAIESNYTGYLRDQDRGDFRRQRHNAVEGFVSGWWERRLRLARRPLRLRVGLEWRGDWFTQDEAMIEVPSRRVWRTDRDASGQTHRVTLAAGGRWVVAPWLQVELGLRGDLFVIDFLDELAGEQRYRDVLYAISPRSMLRFPVARDWTLFAAYGRGFRSPEARAVALRDRPNEDVTLDLYQGGDPEVTVSDEVELGVGLSHGGWLEVSLSGFAVFIDNEIVFDHVSGTNLELNATRRLGADLGLRVRPLTWMELRVDLTGVDARFVESGNPVPGAPRFLTSFGLTVSHRCGLRGSLTGFYLAPRPLAHGATGTHALLLNLAVSYRWRFIEVRLELDNLLDWDWHEGEYHFASWFDRGAQRSLIPVTHVTAGTPFDLRAGVILWL